MRHAVAVFSVRRAMFSSIDFNCVPASAPLMPFSAKIASIAAVCSTERPNCAATPPTFAKPSARLPISALDAPAARLNASTTDPA